MEDIFITIFDFFINAWESADIVLQMLIDLITGIGTTLFEYIGDFIEFVTGALRGIAEGITALFEFFGIDINTGQEVVPPPDFEGGGGSGR